MGAQGRRVWWAGRGCNVHTVPRSSGRWAGRANLTRVTGSVFAQGRGGGRGASVTGFALGGGPQPSDLEGSGLRCLLSERLCGHRRALGPPLICLPTSQAPLRAAPGPGGWPWHSLQGLAPRSPQAYAQTPPQFRGQGQPRVTQGDTLPSPLHQARLHQVPCSAQLGILPLARCTTNPEANPEPARPQRDDVFPQERPWPQLAKSCSSWASLVGTAEAARGSAGAVREAALAAVWQRLQCLPMAGRHHLLLPLHPPGLRLPQKAGIQRNGAIWPSSRNWCLFRTGSTRLR